MAAVHPPTHDHGLVLTTIAATTPVYFVCVCVVLTFHLDIVHTDQRH